MLLSGHSQLPQAALAKTQACNCPGQAIPSSRAYPGLSSRAKSQTGLLYDEQLGMTLRENFLSLAFNVTAVEQTDPGTHTGPAYLVNGLTYTGFWYQVGLSWDWSPGYGFAMSYEVFSPNGTSVFPKGGGGGLANASSAINPGDSVLVALQFDNGRVDMSIYDWQTAATATVSYSDEHASAFYGLPFSSATSRGFFTGLMTEWYHGAPFYQNEKTVKYTESGAALDSAWLWADEFSRLGNTTMADFFDSSSVPVVFTNKTQLQGFESHGATEFADSYEFVTGSEPPVRVTLRYELAGPWPGVTPPILTYETGGVITTIIMSTAPVTFLMDYGSQWRVLNPLGGSNGVLRWQTSGPTNGTADEARNVTLAFFLQYRVIFEDNTTGGSPSGGTKVTFQQFGGPTSAPVGVPTWVDAGAKYNFSSTLTSYYRGERWGLGNGTGSVEGPGNITGTYRRQFYVNLAVNRPEAGHTSASSGWRDAGVNLTVDATANDGWRLDSWSGTGSRGVQNNGTRVTFRVAGPVNETASFFPGLRIAASSMDSISYQYPGHAGSVGPGANATVYVPPGTNVSLLASTTPIVATFGGWNAPAGSRSNAISLVVSAPESVSTVVSFDLFNIGLILAAIVMAVGGSAFYVRRLSERKEGSQGAGSPES